MPIAEYSDRWGYNPRQLMAVHGRYGTPDDLRRFVDRAHSLGMAVIVDVVCPSPHILPLFCTSKPLSLTIPQYILVASSTFFVPELFVGLRGRIRATGAKST